MRPILAAALAATLAAAVPVGAASIRPPIVLAAVPSAAPTGPTSTVPPTTSDLPHVPTRPASEPASLAVPDSTSLWPPDWSQFWPTILATFLGAGLGLAGALYVERRLARKGQQERTRQRQEDQVFALELLADELRRNMAVLRGILNDLERGTVTDRSPVRDVWRSLSAEALAAMRQPSTAAAVLLAYTRLGRIEQRTQFYLDEVRAGGRALSRALEQTLPHLRALVEKSLSELHQAEEGVQSELTRFTGTARGPT